MFCQVCGKEVADGAKFCPNCGASFTGAPAAGAPVAPVSVKPSFDWNTYFFNVLDTLRSFFSKDPAGAVAAAESNPAPVWGALLALNALLCGLAAYVNTRQLASFGYGKLFLYGLLTSLIAFGITTVAIWALLKFTGRAAGWTPVLNAVAVASLPLTAVFIVNLLFGLIYAPSVFVLLYTAVMMTVVLLWKAVRSFGEDAAEPFWAFSLALLVIIVVIMLFGYLFGKSMVQDIAYAAMNSALGSFSF